MENGEILVRFDISFLFTNVPVGKAVSVICKRLRDRTFLSPEQLAELLEMCLKSTYFSYEGNFYEQMEAL